MQKKQIKAGEFYAYIEGSSRRYSTRYRIQVLETDHEFEVRYRHLGESRLRTEVDILAVFTDMPDDAKPFRLRNSRQVIQTWADEMAERKAATDAAEARARYEQGKAAEALVQQKEILALLGEGDEYDRISLAKPDRMYGEIVLVLGTIDAPRLLRLLRAARQQTLREEGYR